MKEPFISDRHRDEESRGPARRDARRAGGPAVALATVSRFSSPTTDRPTTRARSSNRRRGGPAAPRIHYRYVATAGQVARGERDPRRRVRQSHRDDRRRRVSDRRLAASGSRRRSTTPARTSWRDGFSPAGKPSRRRGCRRSCTACWRFPTTATAADARSRRRRQKTSFRSARTWRCATSVHRARRTAARSRQAERHAPHRRGPRVLPADDSAPATAASTSPRRVVRHFVPRERLAAQLLPPLALPERARTCRGSKPRTRHRVGSLFGVPRYLWRQAAADAVAIVKAGVLVGDRTPAVRATSRADLVRRDTSATRGGVDMNSAWNLLTGTATKILCCSPSTSASASS